MNDVVLNVSPTVVVREKLLEILLIYSPSS
jgi:hypothetical protein